MLSQTNIDATTPTGTQLVPGGATFRVWAPRASAVYLHGIFGGRTFGKQTDDRLMTKDGLGYWTGFQDGAVDGDRYRFWIEGPGSSGAKRDPYARELEADGFPNCFAILRDAAAFPWHDAGFRTPDFSDMIVYQAHIGTYAIPKPGVPSTFLDVAAKVPYLADLGINVLQPLPVDEQEANPNMGYSGADLFSPDFPYIAEDRLPDHLDTINGLLAARQQTPLRLADISSGTGQLKALIDLCHVYGIAVILDVVYNHAGGFDAGGHLDDNCLYFMDRLRSGDNNDSLYFTDKDRGTGGLAFAVWNAEVSRFLVENALYYLREFHVDGFRYDEISTLLSTNQGSGWEFCRALTTTLRGFNNRILQNAEFWPRFDDVPNSALPILAPTADGGLGFDVVQQDYLRNVVRDAVGAAAQGAGAPVSMSAIAAALYPPTYDHAWRAVTCIEMHDLVMEGRQPRIAALADGSDHRSWYARSRSRVAAAILLTAPGIPQIFMGQEFLEDKPWAAEPKPETSLWWDGLETDRAMSDHLRFMRELIGLRRNEPALRGDNVHAFHVSDANRVLAYHRWVEGIGRDVVVVAAFAESTWYGYELGFPTGGAWTEAFNSDVYDNWVNPQIAGNGGGIHADGAPLHGFAASAGIVIPANGVVVFVKQ